MLQRHHQARVPVAIDEAEAVAPTWAATWFCLHQAATRTRSHRMSCHVTCIICLHSHLRGLKPRPLLTAHTSAVARAAGQGSAQRMLLANVNVTGVVPRAV